jgi:hypothetical protein
MTGRFGDFVGITANRRLFCVGLSAAALTPAALSAAELPKARGPVITRPSIVGPIPVSATSQPFASSQKPGSPSAALTERYDYIEEEYFISGTANVYGPGRTKGLSAFMGEGKIRSFATAKMQPLAGLAQAAAPYTTRMLMVRPRDNAKFSGRVHLYAFHNIAAQMPVDSNLLENGDAIACVEGCSGTRFGPQEIPSGGVAHLLKFNPERYRDLKLAYADPAVWPDLTPGTLGRMASSLDFSGAGQASDVFLQEIYRSYAQGPDIVTQMAHALRRGDPALPFGNRVKGLYNFAASGGTTFQQPYIQYHHAAGILPDGTPPIDGYLAMVGMIPEVMPKNAILVYLTSEGDLATSIQLGTAVPPDSDAPRVRVYEIPGTGHGISGRRPGPSAVAGSTTANRENDGVLPAGVAGLSERDAPPPGVVPFDKFNSPIIWALWENMYDWVEKGTPMPRAGRIMRDPKSPTGIALDEHGHARGGLRTPWVDVPEANYIPRISPKNPLSAGMKPFPEEKIVQLYGSRENYLKLVKEKIDAMVRDRFVRPEHAQLMLESA